MAWVCVNSFGTELIFETEPHKAVYSWRDDYGSCKCIEIPQGSIKKLIGRELSWSDEPVELKEEQLMFEFYVILTIVVLFIAFMGGVFGYLIGKYWKR